MEGNVGSNISSDTMFVKDEPLWQVTDSHVVSAALAHVSTDHEVKEELEPPDSVFTTHVHVKEEVFMCLKEEEREYKALYGVSESPALVDLYAGHEVKDELVLGPEGLQPADIVFTLYAAQALNAKEQPVVKDCVVRIERIGLRHVENKSNQGKEIHRNTNLNTEKETFVCDICTERFTQKTQIMEHVMTHIQESSQEESMRGAADNVVRRDSGSAAALSARSLSARARRQLAMTCSVRLERLRDEDREHTRDTSGTQLTSKPSPLTLQEHTTAYVCDICSKTFPRKSLFTKHVRTHNVKRAYARDLYNKHCIEKEEKSSLVKHSQFNTGYNYICDVCNKQFKHKSKLIRHVRIHTGQKPYTCDICNKQFAQKGDLIKHVRIHTGQKPYTCDICNKRFTLKSILHTHIRTHTGLKPYSCDICNKRFTRTSHLQTHIRIHTGQKPYTCDICNKRFTDKSNLKRHARLHTGQKPYSCEMCNKQFAQKGDLIKHVRIHTGQKPYTCDICNKQFTRKSDLIQHVRIHTGLKPYSCDICNKRFTKNSSLHTHIRIHTGLKPYTCDICNKQFTLKGALNRHVRIHTRHTLA